MITVGTLKRGIMQVLPYFMLKFLRSIRRVVLFLWYPIEKIAGLTDEGMPPLYLRRYVGAVGGAEDYRRSSENFCEQLKRLTGLRPSGTVLDIGCGCGAVALPLTEYLDGGAYIGIDIYDRAIRWCEDNIASRFGNFRFVCSSVKNPVYVNKGGSAEMYSLPVEASTVDVVLLKSVFTHIRPPEVDNYLGEIGRTLKTGGRCLATFYLMNDEQRRLGQAGQNWYNFRYGEDNWKYAYRNSPETACAYEEDFIVGLLQKHGLSIERTVYGKWSGRSSRESFQDMMVIVKH